MRSLATSRGSLLALSAILLAASCGPTETTCADGIGCVPEEAGGSPSGGLGGTGASGGMGEAAQGGASGGVGGEAGSSSGGLAGEAGQGGASGASAGNGGVGGTPPCDDACGGDTHVCDPAANLCVECLTRADCSGATPACDSATNTCVACTASADCKGTALLCDTATHTCVECLEQSDCSDPTASLCDVKSHACEPCTNDADCSDVAGKNVCMKGECVECTAAKSTACGSNQGTPLVCDSLKHTCTTMKARSADLCQPCVSDAQCMLGELCVLDTLTAGTTTKPVGYFCHWKKGDTANGAPPLCSAARPYFRTLTAATSIDGETADICTLAVSTCPARRDYRAKNCAPTGTPEDALCGFSPPADATCAKVDDTTFRCTMTCGSDDDCPVGFPCNTARGVCEL